MMGLGAGKDHTRRDSTYFISNPSLFPGNFSMSSGMPGYNDTNYFMDLTRDGSQKLICKNNTSRPGPAHETPRVLLWARLDT
jgi:hypothetical protein